MILSDLEGERERSSFPTDTVRMLVPFDQRTYM